jgi:membrane-associated phospholipid phosphatase
MELWDFITSFGDAGLMVPTALIIGLWLYMAQGRAAALLWLGLFSAAGLLVIATKIAFLGFGLGWRRFNFTGISGHSMMSMAVFPVALQLLGGTMPAKRWLLLPLGAAFALLIAVSRVQIGVHSPSEVFSGIMLGGGVALLFTLVAKLPPERMKALPLVSAGLLAVFLAGYGHPAPSQDLVTRLALVVSGRSAPYTKVEWWHGAGYRPHFDF